MYVLIVLNAVTFAPVLNRVKNYSTLANCTSLCLEQGQSADVTQASRVSLNQRKTLYPNSCWVPPSPQKKWTQGQIMETWIQLKNPSWPVFSTTGHQIPHAEAWFLMRFAARRVGGCHGKSLTTQQHHNCRNCEHSSSAWWRVGSTKQGNGVHPDRCCHQCKLEMRNTRSSKQYCTYWANKDSGTICNSASELKMDVEYCKYHHVIYLSFLSVMLLKVRNKGDWEHGANITGWFQSHGRRTAHHSVLLFIVYDIVFSVCCSFFLGY